MTAPPVDWMDFPLAIVVSAPPKVMPSVPAVVVRPLVCEICNLFVNFSLQVRFAVMLSFMASADTVEVIAMDPPVTVLLIVPPLSVVHCRECEYL